MLKYDEIEQISFQHDIMQLPRTIAWLVYVAVYADENGDPEPTLERVGGDQVALMQFAGLHDGHGQEVYEGDVVQNPGGFRYVIEFKDGSFIPKYDGKPYRHNQFAVIGNIYQNPELVK